VPTLDLLLRQVSGRPDPERLLAGFIPPSRFADKTFAGYRPDIRHPSQEAALARLRVLAAEMLREVRRPLASRLRASFGGERAPAGVYLDGGFGVGKTHLLAALWHAAPTPKAYLTFDELVYTIGLLGVQRTRAAFRGHRLVAVDEWELDDPGNLKLALAFLRAALADGVRVATTSNTIPDELGRGRFSQKDFRAEIEEVASAFQLLRVEGDDFRHRRYQADPGRAYFLTPAEMAAAVAAAGPRDVHAPFDSLLAGIATVHPIRYADAADALDALLVDGVRTIGDLPSGLRWVHLVDKLYDSAVSLGATSSEPLSALFPAAFLAGAYGKKFSRCLSRMEEMLGERRAALAPDRAAG
jgi:cell division protein ZapE